MAHYSVGWLLGGCVINSFSRSAHESERAKYSVLVVAFFNPREWVTRKYTETSMTLIFSLSNTVNKTEVCVAERFFVRNSDWLLNLARTHTHTLTLV